MWEIQLYDSNNFITDTFNFILDQDYATPRDMISDMNIDGRYKQLHVAGALGLFQLYRFSIDAGGRFHLTSQPDNGYKAPGYWITYVGSPSMNKLLGFEKVSPYLRFTPDVVREFCRAIDYLHDMCPTIATAREIWEGTYYMQINDLLLKLLAGVKVQNYTAPGGAIIHTMPDTDHEHYLDSVSLEQLHALYKGFTPDPENSTHGQAYLPRHDTPVWVEFYDEPSGSEHLVDPGFKASQYICTWQTEYTANRTTQTISAGTIRLQDIANHDDYVRLPVPTFQPGAKEQWMPVKYLYQANSLPGYYLGGTNIAGSALSTIRITEEIDRRTFRISTLLHHVSVGDDMWIVDELWRPGAKPYSSVHQIHSIQMEGQTGTTIIELDTCLEDRSAAGSPVINRDVFFTNRRVPFQSRTQTMNTPNYVDYNADTNITTISTHPYYHPCWPGDIVYFVIQGASTTFVNTGRL